MVATSNDGLDRGNLELQHLGIVDHAHVHWLRIIQQEFIHSHDHFLARVNTRLRMNIITDATIFTTIPKLNSLFAEPRSISYLSVGSALFDLEFRHARFDGLRHAAQLLNFVDDLARLLVKLVSQILNGERTGQRIGNGWNTYHVRMSSSE